MNNKRAALGLTGLQNVIFNARFTSCMGALFFTAWIAQRVYLNPERHFAFNLVALTWWLITFQYCIFVVSYLTRL